MGFLDNLENDLKNLERETPDPAEQARERERADARRASSAASAPWAEKLKKSSYVNDLLTHATRLGHESRTKINMRWDGPVLRLDARERRLDLEPTGTGIQARFYVAGQETAAEPVDLGGKAEQLARRWLA